MKDYKIVVEWFENMMWKVIFYYLNEDFDFVIEYFLRIDSNDVKLCLVNVYVYVEKYYVVEFIY